jgi:hypothetical protein
VSSENQLCFLENVVGIFLARSQQGLVTFTGASALRTKPDLRLAVSGPTENRCGAHERIQSSDSGMCTSSVEVVSRKLCEYNWSI